MCSSCAAVHVLRYYAVQRQKAVYAYFTSIKADTVCCLCRAVLLSTTVDVKKCYTNILLCRICHLLCIILLRYTRQTVLSNSLMQKQTVVPAYLKSKQLSLLANCMHDTSTPRSMDMSNGSIITFAGLNSPSWLKKQTH